MESTGWLRTGHARNRELLVFVFVCWFVPVFFFGGGGVLLLFFNFFLF